MSDMTDFFRHRAQAIKRDDIDEHAADPRVPGERSTSVCAELPVPLVEHLETVCVAMNVSQRRFIELAVREAIEQADEALADIPEYIDHLPYSEQDA